MFRKRVKKTYPPDTFVETPLRVMAIAQLCIAFTIICWNLSIPFMGDHFILQRKVKLVKHVTTNEAVLGDQSRFNRLPNTIKKEIINLETRLKKQGTVSIIEKAEKSLWHLLVEVPAFELAWIVLGVAVSIMVLKKREGARQAAWILPLLACAYLIDNTFFGVTPPLPDEAKVYPSEEFLLKNFLNKPLESRIDRQKEQLKDAWNRYVVVEWAKEVPSDNSSTFQKQVEEGEYQFTVARVLAMAREKEKRIRKPLLVKEPLPFLLLYVCWNVGFAYLCTRRELRKRAKPLDAINAELLRH